MAITRRSGTSAERGGGRDRYNSAAVTRLSRPLVAPLLLATFLLGCGDSPPVTPAQETAKPLKVAHALGETKVPGRASRPVALYPSELDDALAIGVMPVGAAVPPGSGGVPRYLGRAAASVEAVGPVGRPDLGRIEALHPDVLLGSTPSQKRIYERLSKIAPTVFADERVSWKPNLRQDGEALGRVDDAEALLTAYDGRVGRLRRGLRRHGRVSLRSLDRALPAQVRPFLRRPFIASILRDAGLPHPRAGRRDLLVAHRGRYDEWSLGVGVIAANRVLADLETYLLGR
jgi:iron complex transport system substrate-binding protein